MPELTLDKLDTLITFCLKHILAMPHSNGLWFSSFRRGLQCLGQHRSDKPAAAFHLLHWTLRAACPPAEAPGPWGLFRSRWRYKWENIAGNGKKYLFSKEVSISISYHVENEKAFVLLKVLFSPQNASWPQFPQRRAICPSSQTSQT